MEGGVEITPGGSFFVLLKKVTKILPVLESQMWARQGGTRNCFVRETKRKWGQRGVNKDQPQSYAFRITAPFVRPRGSSFFCGAWCLSQMLRDPNLLPKCFLALFGMRWWRGMVLHTSHATSQANNAGNLATYSGSIALLGALVWSWPSILPWLVFVVLACISYYNKTVYD